MPTVPYPATSLDVSYTPDWEVGRTGKYQGKFANLGYMHCRRTLGWSSTSVAGDVCNYLDTSQRSINTPVNGTSYYIVSTSTADGVGGIGIRSVRINYLDTAGNRIIITVVLNGTTPVFVASNVTYFQYLESSAIGTDGQAQGDIYISSNAGGTPTVAQTMDKIVAGDGRSMSGRVMVPTGFNLYLLGWTCSAVGNTMDVRLRGRAYTDDRTVSPGFHFQENAYLGSGQSGGDTIPSLRFESGAEIKVSAVPGGAPAGNRCDATFKFLLIAI